MKNEITKIVFIMTKVIRKAFAASALDEETVLFEAELKF